MVKFAPEVSRHPRWLMTWVKSRHLPDLGVPNLRPPEEKPPGFFEAYGEWMGTPPCTWDDLAWLRDQWDGPLMIKGVMRIDDAKQAVKIGADCISVSNHGGNNLDTTPASIRALPEIVDAVGKNIEIVLDGGVRRGSDAVKAVALGAKAVMIGRAYLWGLGANGQAGVENVLDIFHGGIDSCLRGLGCSSVKDLVPSDIVMPDGFTRRLGDAPVAPRRRSGAAKA
jgi:isopentenyl diphosphate isomerase/L-lactate dehydrogenase-like FMN-dependent dehydrogenase